VTVLAREWTVALVGRHGGSIDKMSRVLEGATGAALMWIGARELLR
jgi:hypothetical protein